MTPIDEYLLDLADQAGLTIRYTDRLPPKVDGEYIHDEKLIKLRKGMVARHHRSVLAHELGHAAFAHVPSMFGPVHRKQERMAEEWAALRLVDLDDYRHLEAMHQGHAGAIALDLGVMRTIVVAFQGLLARLGDTVYVEPRMGADQWTQRIDVAESA